MDDITDAHGVVFWLCFTKADVILVGEPFQRLVFDVEETFGNTL